MRLLCIGNRYPPWSAGGYEVIWSSAVGAFRRAGHPTRVLTTGPDPSDLTTDAPRDPEVRRDLSWYWRNHEFPSLSPRQALALERSNARTLRVNLEDFRPDVVMWWAMGGMSLSLIEQVRRAGIPALGVVGDEWFAYAPLVDRWASRWRGRRAALAPFVEPILGVPVRMRIDRAAQWMFISAHLRRLASEAGWDTRGADVVHPGVSSSRFRSAPEQPWRWQLLYCGRIDPRKGIATAIEALKHLPPQAVLTVDGSGSQEHLGELTDLAKRLGVSGRVVFRRSAAEEVPAAYAAADAVIFPVTWREPWGLVPLEAMAVGRPVIASDASGGPSEYLEQGANCLRFPAGDPRLLAACVERLADDARLRSVLVDGGRRTSERLSEGAFHGALEQRLRALAERVRSA